MGNETPVRQAIRGMLSELSEADSRSTAEAPTKAPGGSADFQELMALLHKVRSVLELRDSLGKNIRAAMRCLLQAQEVLDAEGVTPEVPLELISASLWAEAAEQQVRAWAKDAAVETPDSTDERRAYPREVLVQPIQLEPDLLLSAESGLHLPIDGETVNISRGGLLARVDQGILESGRYRVRFLGNSDHPLIWGTVRRARANEDAWEAGIEFTSPLANLDDIGVHESTA